MDISPYDAHVEMCFWNTMHSQCNARLTSLPSVTESKKNPTSKAAGKLYSVFFSFFLYTFASQCLVVYGARGKLYAGDTCPNALSDSPLYNHIAKTSNTYLT